MSVIDHPIEYLPTTNKYLEGNDNKDLVNDHHQRSPKHPTRRLKRLSLLNNKETQDQRRRASQSTESSSISSMNSIQRSSSLSTPRRVRTSSTYYTTPTKSDIYTDGQSTPQQTSPMTLFDQ